MKKSLYDPDGNLMEYNTYDQNSELLSKIKFKNDTNGNEIERKTYDNIGKLISIWEFSYDERGNLMESSNCKHAGKDTTSGSGTKVNAVHNEQGQLIKSEVQECDGKPIMIYEFRYDERGNQIEEKLTMPNGAYTTISRFKYDENKNLLIEESTESETYSYTYEFDPIGNWIKKFKYKDDIPQTVLIREIEYYK